MRSFALDLLRDFGFQAEHAENAGDALEKLSLDSAFDVIFSDVVMPGISGIEFAKLVRDRFPNIPVLLTSGYSHVLVEEGRHGFPLLHKPYSADDLARALRDAQSSRGASAEP